GMVFLAAFGADDAAEFPLGEAETAEQAAAAAVALLAEKTQGGFAIAEGAEQRRVAFQLQIRLGAEEFSVGLKEGEHEEFVGIGGGVGVGPNFGEEAGPGVGVGAAKF